VTSCQRPIRGAEPQVSQNRKSESPPVSAASVIRPARTAAKRPISKRDVLSRPVKPAELKRSPNRNRLVARFMVWAVACGGAAFVIPHVMM